MAMDFAVINFRVTPQERQQLRVMLLAEGKTVQSFFDNIVKAKLSDQHGGRELMTRQEAGDVWLARSSTRR